ncbi:MAG: choice-of-anchor D domain-containing protein, partial [Flavobacteriaceae bacterium]|nr:choice-of-anchor D domain-containing protein [Flavobacteriaceae bacterium]
MMKKLLCTLLFAVLAIGFVQGQADINVQGNGINIPDGTTTTSTADGTDFGQVTISSSSAEQLFTIQNTSATDPLTITVVTSTNSTVFAVTTSPASSVAPGGSTSVGVTFNAPGTAGVVNATLFIFTNDPDENPYDFALTGEAVLASNPEINVTGNGISIIGNGTNTPNTSDGTDFGSIASGNS